MENSKGLEREIECKTEKRKRRGMRMNYSVKDCIDEEVGVHLKKWEEIERDREAAR